MFSIVLDSLATLAAACSSYTSFTTSFNKALIFRQSIADNTELPEDSCEGGRGSEGSSKICNIAAGLNGLMPVLAHPDKILRSVNALL